MGVDTVVRDVRFAARQLWRAKSYSVTAAVTLALGIGATTAIFSVVDAVLLRALPYESPERIARAWTHSDEREISDFSFRMVEYRDVRERTDVFEHVGAEFPIGATVTVPGQDAQQIQARMVTADLFRVFGVEPEIGRMFGRDEIEGGETALAVVSHGFWTRFLGADPSAIERDIDLGGESFRLVGVLPRGYRHVSGDDAQIFIPYTHGTEGWIGRWLGLFVRLRPEVGLERADEQISATLAALAPTERRTAGWYATTESLQEMVVGDVRPVVLGTFAMVALVLLVACVNVANLTLARATVRGPELAVRRALGAGRATLLRQLTVEHLLLAALGGLLGLLVASAALDLMVGLAPPSIPRMAETALDPAALGFAAAVTMLTAVLFGVLPAVRMTGRASRSGIGSRARGATDDRALTRTLGALVVAEVALAVTLVVSATLTVRTVRGLQEREAGFAAEGALTFRTALPAARYPETEDVLAFHRRMVDELGALPGVTTVGLGSDLPLSGQAAVASANSEERLRAGVEEAVTSLQRRASPGFFEALGTPVLEGRGFDVRDGAEGELVTIVSASLARALFGDRSAVGERIGFGARPGEDEWMTVVGVVDDVRYESMEIEGGTQIYEPHAQSTTRDVAVVVRTEGDPMAAYEPARAVLRSLDPSVPVYAVATLGGLRDAAIAGRRFTMTLFGLFALVALALSVAGIYGVLAFVVGRRRREIGVRLALGAGAGEVSGLVLRRGGSLVAAGVAVGVALSIAAAGLLERLVYGVPSLDPVSYLVGIALLATVGLGACLVPALGAARVDPAATLREE